MGMIIVYFIGVILLMLAVLYGIRWLMTKTNIGLNPVNRSEFRLIDRFPIDSKRQVIRLQDLENDYVILLGVSDVLLNKTPRTESHR